MEKENEREKKVNKISLIDLNHRCSKTNIDYRPLLYRRYNDSLLNKERKKIYRMKTILSFRFTRDKEKKNWNELPKKGKRIRMRTKRTNVWIIKNRYRLRLEQILARCLNDKNKRKIRSTRLRETIRNDSKQNGKYCKKRGRMRNGKKLGSRGICG